MCIRDRYWPEPKPLPVLPLVELFFFFFKFQFRLFIVGSTTTRRPLCGATPFCFLFFRRHSTGLHHVQRDKGTNRPWKVMYVYSDQLTCGHALPFRVMWKASSGCYPAVFDLGFVFFLLRSRRQFFLFLIRRILGKTGGRGKSKQ